MDLMTHYDVVVAGAGPVGLMLGCELRLGGVARVLVVERLAEVDETIKAGAVNTPTAVALDRRGFLPALVEVQRQTMDRFREFQRARGGDGNAPPPPKFAGHFAGIMLDGNLLDAADPAFADVGPAGDVGLVPQSSLERLLAGRAGELGVELRRGVELTGFEQDDDGVTVHLAPVDRTEPVTAEELQGSLRRVSGVDVTVTEVHTVTRFTDNCRQVTSYRAGRVLLAGDAAHVHSPFGGQGLNLGIGDAMNLGWKLAAVVRGRAPEGLLDSYTSERHPIGAWVLDWTRAQIALMRPESHARTLRGVFTDLTRTVDGTTYLVKKISGVWQHYDLPGGHPLVGRSAPDLEFTDGTRLADHLHGGRALLLDLADDPELRALAEGYGDRADVRTTVCPGRPELSGLLVRPDGFVAWAAERRGAADVEDTEDAEDTLGQALERWLGVPAGRCAGALPPDPRSSIAGGA